MMRKALENSKSVGEGWLRGGAHNVNFYSSGVTHLSSIPFLVPIESKLFEHKNTIKNFDLGKIIFE